ncbi:hypothetical protein SIN8267_00570 [Sinobacterium norvegicum]|uniref:Uncharacterized protein n=1 Tax=Sinobacterium norvegicum TaxID=1641715 RepID=A0ABN8EDQ5_9GAMM|nr:hypothetical protein [Sinobacterium norvegicum]CAH0990478.1 hypothetical protein SIN8267_00570 [Sinobacterium norvegicum]
MRFFIVALTILLSACSSTPHNPTTFQYQIAEGKDEKQIRGDIKNVVIASINFGSPSRHYLQKEQYKVDAAVKSYLTKNGFNLLPEHHFENALRKATYEYGKYYDENTGKLNRNTQQKVLLSVLQQLEESTDADTIIFTDLIERKISFTANMQRQARFDGVTRKVTLQGPSNSVPVDFDWNQLVDAVSLQVAMFDIKGNVLFSSLGGISATQSVDTRKSPPRFVRSRNVLSSTSQIEEGVELAFHPIITMKSYPGKKAQ